MRHRNATRRSCIDRNTIARALLLGAWTAVASPVRAQAPVTEETNRLYRSGHFLGRGDTGIANADDEEAIFYNPAGLASGKGIYKKTVLASPLVEFSQSTKDLARELGAQNANAVETVRNNIGKPNHVGVSDFTGIVLRRAAFGAVASSNVDLLASKSPRDGGLEMVHASSVQNLGLTFSLAEAFWGDALRLGVTTKYLERGRGDLAVSAAQAQELQEKLKDRNNFIGMGTGGGADLGLMLQGAGPMRPSFGLTVSDVGDTKITPQNPTTLDLNLKQMVNAGVAIEPGTKYSKIRLLLDIHDIGGRVIKDDRKKLHLGGELAVLDVVGFTGGLNQGYPTAGLYVDLYVLRLDLGVYSEEVGDRVGTRPDTRYFVQLKAGF